MLKSRHSFAVHTSLRRRATFACLLFILLLTPSLNAANSIATALTLYKQGKYDEVIDYAAAAIKEGQTTEDWFEVKIKAEMTRGKYADALATLDEALTKRPTTVRLRWTGHEVCLFNGDEKRAEAMLDEIVELVKKARWKYTDAANYVTLGRLFQKEGEDPKLVLESFYDRAKLISTRYPDSYIASGDLALEKHDYAVAAQEFTKAAELDPKDPYIDFGLAMAFEPSDSEKSSKALQAALAKNENHIDSRLFIVGEHIDSERYAEAEAAIQKILKINDKHPRAWAYRAVLAHLDNNADREKECRDKALALWAKNPEVDFLIGTKLSQKYRFAEGATYQRKALEFSPGYLPAKMQLSQDLLRLGEEEEGWRLADEVYQDDGYNVIAHNLVTLRDHISKYTILERNGFSVRMESREAQIYGSDVLNLLKRAKKQLCETYEVDLDEPIYVEIFPQQQDFAIRTFGLPGGAGFLGVCFGRVITMNSPASQGNSPSNWQSVLWHEFCHVVTLTKTNNKMPRWLSEGISVYEERQANPSWGEHMDPRYREMVLGDDLTPISQLSAAFLRPQSPIHLQFAYFESSLAVEYLVEKYGAETLNRILVDLGVGMPINESLQRYTGSLEALDQEFAEYARGKAEALAPKLDFTKPEFPPNADEEVIAEFEKEHPDNFWLMQRRAMRLVSTKRWDEAKESLGKLIELYPTHRGKNNAHLLLAKVHRELGEVEKERATLERFAELHDEASDVYLRLIELAKESENWGEVLKNADRMLAVNPLQEMPHDFLAQTAEKKGDDSRAISALEALVVLDPVDPADIHFRLAKAFDRTSDLKSARRNILKSLEEAPRFREAHRELLAIVRKMDNNEPVNESDSTNDTTESN